MVNPNPEAGLRVNVPIELQKLGKVHRVSCWCGGGVVGVAERVVGVEEELWVGRSCGCDRSCGCGRRSCILCWW